MLRRGHWHEWYFSDLVSTLEINLYRAHDVNGIPCSGVSWLAQDAWDLAWCLTTDQASDELYVCEVVNELVNEELYIILTDRFCCSAGQDSAVDRWTWVLQASSGTAPSSVVTPRSCSAGGSHWWTCARDDNRLHSTLQRTLFTTQSSSTVNTTSASLSRRRLPLQLA